MTSRTTDVLIATWHAQPDLDADERGLLGVLAERRVRARPAVWNDPTVDWSTARACLVRSTWDYYYQRDAFLAWAERVATAATLWNPLEVLRWNTHKRYLTELEQRGVPIVPTAWLTAAATENAEALMRERGWDEVVIKPAVSAGSHDTLRVRRGEVESMREALAATRARGDVMMQPFVHALHEHGERALFFIEGAFTHAVYKPPGLRGPLDLADVRPYETSAAERALAERALAAAPGPLLYARVDLIRDDGGALRLLELELTEPRLFVADAPQAIERLADAVAARLRRNGE